MARTPQEAVELAAEYQNGADKSRAEADDLTISEVALGALWKHCDLATPASSDLRRAVLADVFEAIPDDDEEKQKVAGSMWGERRLAAERLQQARSRVSSLAESRHRMADESNDTAARELMSVGLLP